MSGITGFGVFFIDSKNFYSRRVQISAYLRAHVSWHLGRTGGIAGEADALHHLGLVSSYSARAERIITAENETREMPAGVVQEARARHEINARFGR